jgi:hypothetical protein
MGIRSKMKREEVDIMCHLLYRFVGWRVCLETQVGFGSIFSEIILLLLRS